MLDLLQCYQRQSRRLLLLNYGYLGVNKLYELCLTTDGPAGTWPHASKGMVMKKRVAEKLAIQELLHSVYDQLYYHTKSESYVGTGEQIEQH